MLKIKMNNKVKLYEKIIENRFKISIVLIVILTIIGFFMSNLKFYEWIVKTDVTFCLWWNLKLFALLLSSYELFLLITNYKKGISLIGAIVLSFSGIVQWNFNNIDSLIIGIIITILIQKFFEYDKKNQKILISISIILLSSIYVFTFRPYAISFGYIFLALIVWLILKNKDNLIKNKFNIGLGIVTIVFSIICGFIVVKFFDNNNNEYLKIIDSGISPMFSYLYNFLLPFYNFEGRELLGSVITVFPLPMIISLYYLYKKENHIEFLLPMVIVMVFGSVYCMSGFPEIISKVTMLSQVLPLRALAGLQIANLLVMFYFFGNIDEELFNIKQAMRITIVMACVVIFIGLPSSFAEKKYLYIFACEISLFAFLFLNFTDKKYLKVFLFFLTIFTLIGGIPVNFIV